MSAILTTDFLARRARQEAAKLAGAQHYGTVTTAALMREAAKRSEHVAPVIAARAVVKRADAPVFDGPEAA